MVLFQYLCKYNNSLPNIRLSSGGFRYSLLSFSSSQNMLNSFTRTRRSGALSISSQGTEIRKTLNVGVDSCAPRKAGKRFAGAGTQSDDEGKGDECQNDDPYCPDSEAASKVLLIDSFMEFHCVRSIWNLVTSIASEALPSLRSVKGALAMTLSPFTIISLDDTPSMTLNRDAVASSSRENLRLVCLPLVATSLPFLSSTLLL